MDKIKLEKQLDHRISGSFIRKIFVEDFLGETAAPEYDIDFANNLSNLLYSENMSFSNNVRSKLNLYKIEHEIPLSDFNEDKFEEDFIKIIEEKENKIFESMLSLIVDQKLVKPLPSLLRLGGG